MDSVTLVELERTTSPVDGHLIIRMEIQANQGIELEFYTKDGTITCQNMAFTAREAR